MKKFDAVYCLIMIMLASLISFTFFIAQPSIDTLSNNIVAVVFILIAAFFAVIGKANKVL